jgi:hypothetical protein
MQVAQKLCRCDRGVFTSRMCVQSQIFYIASKLFSVVHVAFSNAYPDKEELNKTIHWLATIFWNRGSACLWQGILNWRNSFSYVCTDFKQCISCNNRIWLQELNVATGFIILCVKWFMCISQGYILNGAFCIIQRKVVHFFPIWAAINVINYLQQPLIKCWRHKKSTVVGKPKVFWEIRVRGTKSRS